MKPQAIHWRKVKGLKPPCGKVSLYMSDDPAKVTCPTCRREWQNAETCRIAWTKP